MLSGKTKTGTAFAALLLALTGGMYFSGFITLKLLGVPTPLQWNTYLQYWQALELPQFAPYAAKIKISGAIGFGLSILGWLGALIPLFRSNVQSVHGDARFAGTADLKRAGMLRRTPESILVGKHQGRYLYINGALHVMVVAPTRSGKTTSVAIPVLLSYQHSMVVLDLKGELFKATSGYRASLGQQIYVWAPYAADGKTHRFNPLSFVPAAPRERIAAIQTLAAVLYPDAAGQDPFWIAQSRAAFTAFASYLFEQWDDLQHHGMANLDPNRNTQFPSLERILRFSTGGAKGQGTKQMLEAIVLDRTTYGFVSEQTRSGFTALIALAEETFSSVLATMQAPLQQFLSPILAAATNATDIDVTEIRKQATTIYVIVPTQKLDESSKLLNIFFSTVIGNNLDQQLNENPQLKHQMLMLMDEFTAMGRVDVWAKRISISASYGVRDLCIIQSQAQLRAAYGADDAQNFITNHAASIVFTPREHEDANAYSDMLGYRTIRKRHRSTSRGAGGGNVSYSTTEERRALMLPQEIKELPADDELLFFEGCKPIRCRKNWYFKDRTFKRRILAPVEIPPLVAETPAPPARAGSEPAAPGEQMPAANPDPRAIKVPPALQEHYDRHRPYLPPTPTEKGTLITVHKPAMPDPLHDLNLKRMMRVANERAVRELGPLPPGGLPTQIKGKAPHIRPGWQQALIQQQEAHAASLVDVDLTEIEHKESDDVLKKQMAAAVFAAGVMTGCTGQATQTDDYFTRSRGTNEWILADKPSMRFNSSPQEKYEVILTLHNAPGPFAAIRSKAEYQAPDCGFARRDGGSSNPAAGVPIDYVKVDEHTYRGVLHRDALLDEDYDGAGGEPVCRWELMRVRTALSATGVPADSRFVTMLWLPWQKGMKSEESETTYFNKINYPSKSNPPPNGYNGVHGERDPDIADANLFAVTVSVRKVQP